MYTLHVTGKPVSSCGHKPTKLFISDKLFVYVVPMKEKTEIPQVLKDFYEEIGVPVDLIFDTVGVLVQKFKQGFWRNEPNLAGELT